MNIFLHLSYLVDVVKKITILRQSAFSKENLLKFNRRTMFHKNTIYDQLMMLLKVGRHDSMSHVRVPIFKKSDKKNQCVCDVAVKRKYTCFFVVVVCELLLVVQLLCLVRKERTREKTRICS